MARPEGPAGRRRTRSSESLTRMHIVHACFQQANLITRAGRAGPANGRCGRAAGRCTGAGPGPGRAGRAGRADRAVPRADLGPARRGASGGRGGTPAVWPANKLVKLAVVQAAAPAAKWSNRAAERLDRVVKMWRLDKWSKCGQRSGPTSPLPPHGSDRPECRRSTGSCCRDWPHQKG